MADTNVKHKCNRITCRNEGVEHLGGDVWLCKDHYEEGLARIARAVKGLGNDDASES